MIILGWKIFFLLISAACSGTIKIPSLNFNGQRHIIHHLNPWHVRISKMYSSNQGWQNRLYCLGGGASYLYNFESYGCETRRQGGSGSSGGRQIFNSISSLQSGVLKYSCYCLVRIELARALGKFVLYPRFKLKFHLSARGCYHRCRRFFFRKGVKPDPLECWKFF